MRTTEKIRIEDRMLRLIVRTAFDDLIWKGDPKEHQYQDEAVDIFATEVIIDQLKIEAGDLEALLRRVKKGRAA